MTFVRDEPQSFYVGRAVIEESRSSQELEFEYEPGISLGSMEFGQAGGYRPPYQRRSVLYCPSATSSTATAASLFNETSCFFCGVDYESGRRGRRKSAWRVTHVIAVET